MSGITVKLSLTNRLYTIDGHNRNQLCLSEIAAKLTIFPKVVILFNWVYRKCMLIRDFSNYFGNFTVIPRMEASTSSTIKTS